MRDLQEEVQLDLEPEDAPETAFRSKAVRLRPVPGEVHPVRAPEAAQEVTHEREAVHLPGLRQEVHKRERAEDPLEDDQLQAEQHRGRAGPRGGDRFSDLLRVRA